MTPPLKAWVTSEAWAISLGPGHEEEAGEQQGESGEAAPALPSEKFGGRRPRLTPGLPPSHTGEQEQDEPRQSQDLPETAFLHTLLMTP